MHVQAYGAQVKVRGEVRGRVRVVVMAKSLPCYGQPRLGLGLGLGLELGLGLGLGSGLELTLP